MWYFAWVLGLFAAAIFAVVNAIWLELQEDDKLLQGADRDVVAQSQSEPDPSDHRHERKSQSYTLPAF